MKTWRRSAVIAFAAAVFGFGFLVAVWLGQTVEPRVEPTTYTLPAPTGEPPSRYTALDPMKGGEVTLRASEVVLLADSILLTRGTAEDAEELPDSVLLSAELRYVGRAIRDDGVWYEQTLQCLGSSDEPSGIRVFDCIEIARTETTLSEEQLLWLDVSVAVAVPHSETAPHSDGADYSASYTVLWEGDPFTGTVTSDPARQPYRDGDMLHLILSGRLYR